MRSIQDTFLMGSALFVSGVFIYLFSKDDIEEKQTCHVKVDECYALEHTMFKGKPTDFIIKVIDKEGDRLLTVQGDADPFYVWYGESTEECSKLEKLYVKIECPYEPPQN